MSYTSAWAVIPQIVVKKERWIGGHSTQGIPLVSPGQTVQPDQPVLRLLRPANPEVVSPLQAANQLQHSAETLPAGLRGRVLEITPRGGVMIESYVARVQGILGVGPQIAGVLTIWQTSHSALPQPAIPPGAILVIPGPLTFSLLHQAVNSGVVGLIASSISLRDLEGFLRTDVIQLVDKDERQQAQLILPPLTLLLTEGLGSLPMAAHSLNLFQRYQGSICLLSGTTSLSQGLYPELLVSLPSGEIQANWHPVQPDRTLSLGALVRVSGGERNGVTGIIDYFFLYEQVFSSKIHARALRLRLDDGSTYVVPLALVERIG